MSETHGDVDSHHIDYSVTRRGVVDMNFIVNQSDNQLINQQTRVFIDLRSDVL